MELLNKYDLQLKQKSVDFDFQKDDPEKLFTELKEYAAEHKGIGLSACQVGIMKRVFVVGDPDDLDNYIPFFNPRIVDTFGEDIYYEEGCLTFPGLWIKVKRPRGVRIRFLQRGLHCAISCRFHRGGWTSSLRGLYGIQRRDGLEVLSNATE